MSIRNSESGEKTFILPTLKAWYSLSGTIRKPQNITGRDGICGTVCACACFCSCFGGVYVSGESQNVNLIKSIYKS